MFMNDWDITRALRAYEGHPALGPAARTVANLRDLANDRSDGWAYYPKPARAARGLMRLLCGDRTYGAEERQAASVTAADVRKAYGPVRAFLTRQGWPDIVEPIG